MRKIIRDLITVIVAVTTGAVAAVVITGVAVVSVSHPQGHLAAIQAGIAGPVVTTAYVRDSGQERFCKYFPPGRSWPYSSSTHDRWKKLAEDGPDPVQASLLSAWIASHGEHKNPGRLFGRVHRACNP